MKNHLESLSRMHFPGHFLITAEKTNQYLVISYFFFFFFPSSAMDRNFSNMSSHSSKTGVLALEFTCKTAIGSENCFTRFVSFNEKAVSKHLELKKKKVRIHRKNEQNYERKILPFKWNRLEELQSIILCNDEGSTSQHRLKNQQTKIKYTFYICT